MKQLKTESMKNQDNLTDFNGHHEAHKRKWPYSESNSYTNYTDNNDIVAKKSMTSYNYENFQPNQYIISTNGQEQHNDSNDGTVNCSQQQTQMINTMEISENIEYVNILYEDDLLTSIQAPVATETNYIQFETNWGNADILDLDQRNYYYETSTANTIQLNNLNGQLTHHNEHDTTIHQITHNETQNIQITEQRSNNHIHQITEYEVVQNVYPEAENQSDNLRKFLK